MTPTSGSDPRMSDTHWPCMGQHTETVGNNRYGKWVECSACNLRLAYIPAINVVEALERLRNQGWKKEELGSNTVKTMIKQVASEKVTNRANKCPSKTKEKKKARPATEEIHSGDSDSFQLMDPPKEIKK